MSGSFLSQPDKRAKKLYIFIIIFLGAYVNRQGKYGGEIFGGFMGNVYKYKSTDILALYKYICASISKCCYFMASASFGLSLLMFVSRTT